MKLRDYQAECIQEVKNRLPTVNSQLVQLPTGSGKTVIFWHLLRDLNKRALIIAPTRELVEQIQDTGGEVVYHRDIYAKRSSWVPAEWPQFTTMTIKAAAMLFKKQPERLPNIDYLVFDEAHRSQATQAAELIEHYKESGVKIIGLTATPERLDGKSLMDLYEVLTYKKTLVDLIRHGHLVDLECYRVKTRFKLPGARMSAGDISPAALRELDLDARNEIILKTFLDNCLDKKTLIFCLSIDHANEIARQLREKGVSAAAVHGSMPSKERKQIINDFKSGKIRALCNCQLLTEGFDDPSIEALVLARPTKSKALYCQMIGRGVRPYEGKEVCFVYDITDEIHDICTFNVLGEFKEKGEFEFEQGERLLDACDRRLLSVDEVEVVVEKFDMYERPTVLATDYQKQWLAALGAPFLDGLTFQQAAYLLWKTRFMEKNGINSRDYWKAWGDVSSCHEWDDRASESELSRPGDGDALAEIPRADRVGT